MTLVAPEVLCHSGQSEESGFPRERHPVFSIAYGYFQQLADFFNHLQGIARLNAILAPFSER
jgi:hypothetical protein